MNHVDTSAVRRSVAAPPTAMKMFDTRARSCGFLGVPNPVHQALTTQSHTLTGPGFPRFPFFDL